MRVNATRWLSQCCAIRRIDFDDCIFGAGDRGSATKIRKQLVALLAREGFRLRKWASNCPHLLEELDPRDHGLACSKDLRPDESLQVLGISWHPGRDIFHFRISLSQESGKTKRELLSTIAKFYDPLGWVTPVLVTAKMLLQRLWSLKCDWDDEVPAPVMAEWSLLHAGLPALERLSIPRWTGFNTARDRCELHAFADASTQAYAAAIYLRAVPSSGSSTVKLLIAKSKIAPLKTISVSRLELCASVLLARLLRFVTSTLKLEASYTYC